jgi:hypothetical protein
MYEFLTRFVAAGGNVTKLSYTINARNDEGIRSILSFNDDVLRVHNDDGQNVYDATGSFLHDKAYEFEIERVVRERAITSKYYRPVKLLLKIQTK